MVDHFLLLLVLFSYVYFFMLVCLLYLRDEDYLHRTFIIKENYLKEDYECIH